jgi:DNA modification methylase
MAKAKETDGPKLKFDPENMRTHGAKSKRMIRRALEEVGAGRSIWLDSDNVIVAGNGVYEQAKELGIPVRIIESDGKELIAVKRTDMKGAKQRLRAALMDNRASELSEWDTAKLGTLSLPSLAGIWAQAELKTLLGKTLPAEPQAEDDDASAIIDRAAELQRKWKTKPGQLWEIGGHRLLCGDSGDPEAVKLVMKGKKASLMATDPPYGVDLGVTGGPDTLKRFGEMAGDGKAKGKLKEFLLKIFTAAAPNLKASAAWYLWHAMTTQHIFAEAAAEAAELLIHRQIIWVKSRFVLGHGDFHYKHEPCFYGWRQGHRPNWYGDRAQTTTWEIDRIHTADAHPTERPVEIFARPMRLNTLPGEICYEPFSGSGTQLVAAEQLGRVCYAIEIEPKYIAVALERLANTGLKPKLAKGGNQ